MFYFKYGCCLGMNLWLFYVSSSDAIRDLPAGDMNKLLDLSDDDMMLGYTNYFEILVTNSRKEGTASYHK